VNFVANIVKPSHAWYFSCAVGLVKPFAAPRAILIRSAFESSIPSRDRKKSCKSHCNNSVTMAMLFGCVQAPINKTILGWKIWLKGKEWDFDGEPHREYFLLEILQFFFAKNLLDGYFDSYIVGSAPP
jgi:hypothetical protein